ncbi:MAG: DUF1778 domain-containing protein [Betaproteobacteria bacterium]|nr:DUF1778 domain-containing protein [Betaproteobacteria bacterium]
MPPAPAATKPATTTRDKSRAAAQAAAQKAVKRDRLHLRLDTASRHKLEQAAQYLNKTTSEFVLTQAVIAAEKVIEVYGHTIALSEAEWSLFCRAVDNPPKPNSKLKQAVRRYVRRGGKLAG